jgi:hypothetical protein
MEGGLFGMSVPNPFGSMGQTAQQALATAAPSLTERVGSVATTAAKAVGADTSSIDTTVEATKGLAAARAAQSAAPSGSEGGKKYIQGIFNQPVSLTTHRLLTGIFPFAALQPLVSLIPGVGPLYQAVCAMIFSAFYTLGSNGANLLVSGSMGWAVAKAGSTQLLKGLYFLLSKMYPGQKWLPYLKAFINYANPWFTFDIVQTYSPNFSREGYKLPFINKYLNSNIAENQETKLANMLKVGQKDADGNVILSVEPDEKGQLQYITGQEAAAAAAEEAQKKRLRAPKVPPDCLPKSLTPSDIGFKIPETDLSGNPVRDDDGNPVYKEDPVTNQTQVSYGHMTAVILGMMFLYIYPWYLEISSAIPPELQPVLSSWAGWVVIAVGTAMGLVATVGVAGIYAIPGALPQLKQLFFSKTQGGGGSTTRKQGGGGTIPDMNDIIHNVLNNTQDEIPFEQSGGGAIDKDESTVFLGSLAIVSLLGIALAVRRNKIISRKSV